MISDKYEILQEKAERNRAKDSDASWDRAEEYDEICEEIYSHMAECECRCTRPASDLRCALEEGDLDAAVKALQDGNFFLDIGAV